ncbi:tetratricopeptide repeat protein [Lactobacillus sp. PV037]|uniref:tetratricopeptide repeat protein n=1 Tax=unclassified Lactobacillus TaxID=2620435 RepID=UPI00224023DE|nr:MULTISPECIES: CDC27 family protein [unclassified Lactobacillus]QNQ82444.1 tetratricopeptide repeat protein [Lactobacillus sp. PV012]QNQ83442.1 tetratricopeptide repeat protein [Lactobacillus sp. PV037]
MDKKIADLYDSGKTDLAIHQLIEKIDHDSKNIDNYLQLSTYLIDQNSIAQALELLQKASAVVDKPQDLAYNLAVCYYLEGDFNKSLSLLNQLENTQETIYQKALVFLKLGQYQKALAYALSLRKQDKRTLELLGDIWLSLGDLNQAKANYEKIEAQDRSSKVEFLLGLTLLEENLEQAHLHFDLSKQKDPTYFKQANAQYASLLKLIRGKNGNK